MQQSMAARLAAFIAEKRRLTLHIVEQSNDELTILQNFFLLHCSFLVVLIDANEWRNAAARFVLFCPTKLNSVSSCQRICISSSVLVLVTKMKEYVFQRLNERTSVRLDSDRRETTTINKLSCCIYRSASTDCLRPAFFHFA